MMLRLGKNHCCCSIEQIKRASLARRPPNELACDWLLGLCSYVANQSRWGYRLGPRRAGRPRHAVVSANQCTAGLYRNVLLRRSRKNIWLVVTGLAFTAPFATTPINCATFSRRPRRPNKHINRRASHAVFYRAPKPFVPLRMSTYISGRPRPQSPEIH